MCPFKRQTFVIIASDKLDFKEIEDLAEKLNTDSPCLYDNCELWNRITGRCSFYKAYRYSK